MAKTAPKKLPALRVVSLSPASTFRRAGFTFNATPTVLLMRDLQPDQVAAIRATPMLDVSQVMVDEPGAADAAQAEGASTDEA